MRLQTWMFEFCTAFAPPGSAFDPQSCASDYAWYLGQWAAAEQRGFTGIFFSEHHFSPGLYSPSPNLLIASVAPLTRHLRLGVMGNVVPLYEPWRLAEEIAMLDQLSGGRLEVGLASGIGPREFLAVGLKADEIRARFDEALEVIDGLLRSEKYRHRGRFWQFEQLGIAPRCLQQPLPPRWMAGMSAHAAAAAASRRFRFCTGFMGVNAAREHFAHYREVAAMHGFEVGTQHCALRRMVHIADDREQAVQVGRSALERTRQIMAGHAPSAAAAPSAAGAPGASAVPDAPQAAPGGGAVADEEIIAGDVESVAEQIRAQCAASGAGHFLGYRVNSLSRATAERSDELWAEVNRRLAQTSV